MTSGFPVTWKELPVCLGSVPLSARPHANNAATIEGCTDSKPPAKKHSVTVHAAFHSSLRPRDGKEEYAVALGFDIMRNVAIERKQTAGLHLDDLFLSVNLDLASE